MPALAGRRRRAASTVTAVSSRSSTSRRSTWTRTKSRRSSRARGSALLADFARSDSAPPELRLDLKLGRGLRGTATEEDVLEILGERDLAPVFRRIVLEKAPAGSTRLAAYLERELAGARVAPAERGTWLRGLARLDPAAADRVAADAWTRGTVPLDLDDGEAGAYATVLDPDRVRGSEALRAALRRARDIPATALEAATALARAGDPGSAAALVTALLDDCPSCRTPADLAALFGPLGEEGREQLSRLAGATLPFGVSALDALFELEPARAEALGRAGLEAALEAGCVPEALLPSLLAHGIDPFPARRAGRGGARVRPESSPARRERRRGNLAGRLHRSGPGRAARHRRPFVSHVPGRAGVPPRRRPVERTQRRREDVPETGAPENSTESRRLRVVVVGGGFAGLALVRGLRGAPVDVTLVDRRNFHLFQPLLYQVATGGLSPANIAAPLRALVKRQRNVRVLLAEATDVDAAGRRLLLADGSIPYDVLVLATGARHSYFGRPEWEARAPGLKTLEDATGIRSRILTAFESAEREEDEGRRREWLTFVIVGAGPTGAELAGALAEIARHTLKDEFRRIDPSAARILLVEGADRVLGAYDPALSARAAGDLARLGVEVRTGAIVTDVRVDGVTLRLGEADEAIRARTVLWAAGVEGSELGRILAGAAGATTDRAGRVAVGPDLALAGHPELFVVGDLAVFTHQTGKPLPGVAPVAMQQGRFVARTIRARLAGREEGPFRYADKGSLATIGRASAVAEVAGLRFGGYLAWLTWLFVHLLYIVQFGNRVLVLVQWAWSYLTWGRSARLITAPAAKDASRPSGPGTSPVG